MEIGQEGFPTHVSAQIESGPCPRILDPEQLQWQDLGRRHCDQLGWKTEQVRIQARAARCVPKDVILDDKIVKLVAVHDLAGWLLLPAATTRVGERLSVSSLWTKRHPVPS